ncbi:MAG: heme transport system ATP-binding protein [Frankiaceae bacterium]|nr:heme transport system ATP-binding protein [Frankiaceae bacterium]
MTALAACGVRVERCGRTVLAASLFASYGELVAVAGPNGAGKSTLLATLAGDVSPVAGEVRLDGRPIGSYPPATLARLRSVLPQRSAVTFPFRVAEVVAMGRAAWAGTPRAAFDDAAVEAALGTTELAALRQRPVTRLSGGEQARVALARVLAQDTPVVLLDEPTASLDLRHQERVLREARRLADAGRAVVAVLHDLGAAAAYADTVVLLHRGRVVAAGPPGEVLDPAVVSAVYDQPVDVVRHPVTGAPLVTPRRDARSGAGARTTVLG